MEPASASFRSAPALARPSTLRHAVPPLVLAALVFAVWSHFGVGIRDSLTYVAYEAVFIVAPGCVFVRALSPGGGRLRLLVLGWTAGYALEIFAFAATAAVGLRGLFVAYPAVVVAGAVVLARLAPPRTAIAFRPLRIGAPWLTAVCGIAAFGVLGFALWLYRLAPLPWSVSQVAYHPDLVGHIAYAAEARHHWPIEYPLVSGTPFGYHTFLYMHLAAADQVTHVGLPLIVLRLFDPSVSILLTLQLAYLGARIARRAWAGPVVAALALVAGEIDLDARYGSPGSAVPFLGGFPIATWLSPSFQLGTVFFAGALILLVEHVGGAPRRHVALLALVLAGAAGVKATILPLLAGGLVVLAAVEVVVRRRPAARTLGALGLVAALAVVFFLTLYRGAESGFGLSPGVELKRTYAVLLFRPAGGSIAGALWWPVAVVVAGLGLYGAGLAGLAGVRRARLLRPGPEVFLLGVFAAGLLPLALLSAPANDQLYFAEYGGLALAVVGGAGLYRLLAASVRASGARVRATLLAGGWGALLTAVAVGAAHGSSLGGRSLYAVVYGVFLGGVAGAVAVLRTRGRRVAIATAAAAIAVAAALNIPLDLLPRAVQDRRHGIPPYDASTALTTDLYRGYVWVREHTSPRDVLAVDAYAVVPAGKPANNFYLAAFAERRVFLEGWVYAPRSRALGAGVFFGTVMPYPERYRLNEAVFRRGDRRALGVLTSRYGVRYLVADLVHGGRAPGAARLGRRVYANADIQVYAVG